MSISLRPEKEINIIRGKMLVGAATKDEIHDFLSYVSAVESLIEEPSNEDFWGSEGWRHMIGWD